MTYPAMGKKVKLCVLFSFLFSINHIYAQRYRNYDNNYTDRAVLVELGGGIGLMNCLTDLGGGKGEGKKFIKDINWKNSQLASSGYLGFTFNDVFGIRLEATFGKVKAYDSVLSKDKEGSHGRYYRNLSFQSNINEYAAIAEFHPLMLKDYSDEEPPRLSPYLLAGIAKFSFNPQTYYQGQLVDLQPLHLEGQGFAEYKDRQDYRLLATSYPVGLGLRYEVGGLLFIRAEAVYRLTSTDYLDDVSQERYVNPNAFVANLTPAQAALAKKLYSRSYEVGGSVPNENDSRGYSTNKDSYFSFNLKIGLVMNRGRIH